MGVVAAGATGLLVWGQAQTELRGQAFRIGNGHFWLGIAIGVGAVAVTADWLLARRRADGSHRPRVVPVLAALLVVGVVVQGYLGGRMSYDQGVGVQDGGQWAQTAIGSQRLAVALAKGVDQVSAGRQAFSAQGLGCAGCHGDQAQDLRGPQLAGGRDVEEFRQVHGHGLFPPKVVSDRQFAAIDAWLKTLGPGEGEGGGGDGDAG